MKINKKYLPRRGLVALLGFAAMAFGVAFSIKSSLGTSPISSLPYVTGEISGLTVGTTTIIMHCFFVLLQILLLKREYQIFQLSQLLVAVIFGTLTDLAVGCIGALNPGSYPEQWLFCLIGIVLVGLGVSLEVAAQLVMVAGEGLVLAICSRFHLKFGNTKVGFDVTLVVLSVVLSLLFLGKVAGVREGTLAAALLVGQVAKLAARAYGPLNRWMGKTE